MSTITYCLLVTVLYTITAKAQPNVTLTCSNNPLILGETLVLYCVTNVNETVHLSVNGVLDSNKIKSKVNSYYNTTFYFTPDDISDSGTQFQCVIRGAQSNILSLIIYFSPNYTLPVLHPVFSGATYQLTLHISSLPYPYKAIWTHNGTPINSSQYVTTAHSILFNPLVPNDNGIYTVQSYNPAGNGSISFNLIVYYGPSFVEGSNVTRWVEFKIGSDFNLTCTVSESNPPFYTLATYNMSTYTDNIELIYTSLSATYQFTDSTVDNNGYYTCQSIGNYSITNLTYWLFIGGPPVVSIECNIEVNDNMIIADINITDNGLAPAKGLIIDILSIINKTISLTEPIINSTKHISNIVLIHTDMLSAGNYTVNISVYNDISTVNNLYITELIIPESSTSSSIVATSSTTNNITSITSNITSTSLITTTITNIITSIITSSTTESVTMIPSSSTTPTTATANGGVIAAAILVPFFIIVGGAIIIIVIYFIIRRKKFSRSRDTGYSQYEHINSSSYESFERHNSDEEDYTI